MNYNDHWPYSETLPVDKMYSEMESFKLLDICDEIESYEEKLQAAYSPPFNSPGFHLA